MSNPKTAPTKRPEAAPDTKGTQLKDKAGIPSSPTGGGASRSEGSDEAPSLISELLGELDYIQHREKKVDASDVAQPALQTTLQSQLPKAKLSIPGERLLGILGHCGLKGHIAHFYNLQFEIERHIRTVAELEDERFVRAYDYLKANPSTEAVFVYDNRMLAAKRVGGRLIQKDVIDD